MAPSGGRKGALPPTGRGQGQGDSSDRTAGALMLDTEAAGGRGRHTAQILILGLGNLLWADEGFGVRALESLHNAYVLPDHVQLLDGGTQGLNLLAPVQEADVLVLFDAVDYGRPPGQLCCARDEDVPRFLSAGKMSLHQSGFQEVLAGAQLLGRAPEHLLLIGVQPAELADYGGSLSEPVRAQLGPAVNEALAYLAAWGIDPERRHAAVAPEQAGVPDRALQMARYEEGRPGPAAAWRHGDPRFFQDT